MRCRATPRRPHRRGATGISRPLPSTAAWLGRKPLATTGGLWSRPISRDGNGSSGTAHASIPPIHATRCRLRETIPTGGLIVIWDGAPYHRAGTVQAAAARLNITILPLPGDSPDLMPVEPLWRWLREDVTHHH